MNHDIADNLGRVRERISRACERAGRDPEEVGILAVTKTHPVETMQEALRLGLTDLGENRVQEALPKIVALPAEARVHLIGRLQTNKVNKAVGPFASIQSVDRPDLLERIARRAAEMDRVQNLWIQVDIAEEEQKAGCPPEQAVELWEHALSLGSTSPQGLMGMVRLEDDEPAARRRFARLRKLSEGLRRRDADPARLSMGMSRDFEWAVEEGSHQLRLGSVLFGARGPR